MGFLFFRYRNPPQAKLNKPVETLSTTAPHEILFNNKHKRVYINKSSILDSKHYLKNSGRSYIESGLLLKLNQHIDLQLTTQEKNEILAIYSAIYTTRVNFEVTQAKVAILSPLENIIEIPAYPKNGILFKKIFENEVVRIIGESRAAQFENQLGTFCEAENSYWGSYPQAFLIEMNEKGTSYTLSHVINPSAKNTEFYRESVSNLDSESMGSYEQYLPLFPRK
jgi:hypothetical protein